jgi:hypothetical protein
MSWECGVLAGDLIPSQLLTSEEFNLKKCDQLVPSWLSQGIAASLFNRFSCKIIAPNLGSVIHTHPWLKIESQDKKSKSLQWHWQRNVKSSG